MEECECDFTLMPPCPYPYTITSEPRSRRRHMTTDCDGCRGMERDHRHEQMVRHHTPSSASCDMWNRMLHDAKSCVQHISECCFAFSVCQCRTYENGKEPSPPRAPRYHGYGSVQTQIATASPSSNIDAEENEDRLLDTLESGFFSAHTNVMAPPLTTMPLPRPHTTNTTTAAPATTTPGSSHEIVAKARRECASAAVAHAVERASMRALEREAARTAAKCAARVAAFAAETAVAAARTAAHQVAIMEVAPAPADKLSLGTTVLSIDSTDSTDDEWERVLTSSPTCSE